MRPRRLSKEDSRPGFASSNPDRALSIAVQEVLAALPLGLYFALTDVSREAHFLLTVAMVVYMARGVFPVVATAIGVSWPLYVMMLLGLLVSTFESAFDRDMIKGLWYESRVPVYLMFGALLAARRCSLNLLINAVFIAAKILALQYIFKYVTDPIVSSGSADRFYVRSEIGHGSILSCFALVFVAYQLFVDKQTSHLRFATCVGITAIILLSVALAQSRSSLVALAVIFLFAFKLIPLRAFARVLVPLFVILGFFLTTPLQQLFVPEMSPATLSNNVPDFVNELLAIPREGADIYYWRGYETYQAFSFITDQGLGAILAGTGLHSLVPLHEEISLGYETSAIPIFHNGYSFFFVRGGMIGICLLVVLHILLARQTHSLTFSTDRSWAFYGRFACGLLALAIMQLPTTTGFFNYGEDGSTASILLGFAVGLVGRQTMMSSLKRSIRNPGLAGAASAYR